MHFSFSLLDYACWGMFLLVWTIGAAYNALRGPSTARRSPAWRGQVLLVAGIAVIIARFVPHTFWAGVTLRSERLSWAGSALLTASTAFMLWARFVLGRMWSSAPKIKEGHRLRTTGPYAVTRHPIYTGLLGMTFGTMLEHGFGISLPFVVLLVLVIILKARSEEHLLSEEFGEEYSAYRRAVPQLIPWLKLPRQD